MLENKIESREMFAEYDDIVSIEDVMKMLHIGRSNVYKLLREKEIKHIRIWSKIYYSKKRALWNTSKRTKSHNCKS